MNYETEEQTLYNCRNIYAKIVPLLSHGDWKTFLEFKIKIGEQIPEDAIDFIARLYHQERNRITQFKSEETNKLIAEEYLNKYLAEFEEEAIPMERYGLLHFSESFASMKVEQERKDKNAIIEQVKFLLIRNGELEQEKKEEKERMIQFITKCINSCDEQIEIFVNSGMGELTGGSAAMKCAYQVILNEFNNVK